MNREESTEMAPRAPRRNDAERRLLDVLSGITDRDRTICRRLYEHRTLTASQVTDIGLSGERRTRMRLGELCRTWVHIARPLVSWSTARRPRTHPAHSSGR